MIEQPFVSVVTPVYNGERYLASCIESVLSQTYRNFEYILLNNCSEDNTGGIMAEYAQKDKRIKIVNNNKLLPIIENWNESTRHVSKNSKYYKVVHADDLLFEDCLEKMVAVAEKDSDIVLVSTCRIIGNLIEGAPTLYPQEIFSGNDICSKQLINPEFYIFGSPSTVMIKSAMLWSRDEFYDETELHADADVCFDILKDRKFGFVHQILSFSRMHKGSETSKAVMYNSNMIFKFKNFLKYGPRYLDDATYKKALAAHEFRYYTKVARDLMAPERKIASVRKCYLQWHRTELAKVNYKFNSLYFYRRLAKKTLKRLIIR